MTFVYHILFFCIFAKQNISTYKILNIKKNSNERAKNNRGNWVQP